MNKFFEPLYQGDNGPHVREYSEESLCSPQEHERSEMNRINARNKKIGRMLREATAVPESALSGSVDKGIREATIVSEAANNNIPGTAKIDRLFRKRRKTIFLGRQQLIGTRQR